MITYCEEKFIKGIFIISGDKENKFSWLDAYPKTFCPLLTPQKEDLFQLLQSAERRENLRTRLNVFGTSQG